MSYFRDNIDRIAGYTPGFQPKEPGFVKLNTNENPYPLSPAAVAAMQDACGETIRKYPDPMADAFRRAAADVLGVRPTQIMCGFGSDDVLTIALRSFCAEGDLVAFPEPTYSLYEVLADIQGARRLAIPFGEDYELPADLATTGAKLTLLANPNAPSGTLVPTDEVETLARALDGVLLIDEAYVDFASANCLSLVDKCENVIVSRTLSKSYSMAGLRFGFAIANETLIDGMIKVKDSYNVSAPAVAGAAAAIADRKTFRRNVDRIVATRARLVGALEALGFSCRPSEANFVLARVPEGRDAAAVFQALFDHKVLVRYFNLPRLDDCLRVTVGTDAEIDALLAALSDIL